jgi:hypothetical protein
MKKLIVLFCLISITAFSQSVTITIAANDGSNSTTSTISVPAVRVQGLMALWAEDCKAKTNANPPTAALNFSQFVVQEIRDRGTDYANKGATKDMLSWGLTNPPAKLVTAWPGMTLEQKTNAVNYIKQIGE